MNHSSIPLLIDTDNACGSMTGDIDDAFAILALISSQLPIAAIVSVFGNTSSDKSFENTKALIKLTKDEPLTLRGSRGPKDKSETLNEFISVQKERLKYAALGPLTNLSSLVRNFGDELTRKISEVVLVGSNSETKGRFPPIWPHEFNLTKDVAATRTVLDSNLNLTVFPLNVVKKLEFNQHDIENLPEGVLDFFRKNSSRWLMRNRLLKGKSRFPVWDLVPAMYLINPENFVFQNTKVACSSIGHLSYGKGSKLVKILTDFDPEIIKKSFFKMVHANHHIHQAMAVKTIHTNSMQPS